MWSYTILSAVFYISYVSSRLKKEENETMKEKNQKIYSIDISNNFV